MEPQNALDILRQVASVYLCNEADRRVIDNALMTLQVEINRPKAEEQPLDSEEPKDAKDKQSLPRPTMCV